MLTWTLITGLFGALVMNSFNMIVTIVITIRNTQNSVGND